MIASQEQVSEPLRVPNRLRLARQPLPHRAVGDTWRCRGRRHLDDRDMATVGRPRLYLEVRPGSHAALRIRDDVGEPGPRLAGKVHAVEDPASGVGWPGAEDQV